MVITLTLIFNSFTLGRHLNLAPRSKCMC